MAVARGTWCVIHSAAVGVCVGVYVTADRAFGHFERSGVIHTAASAAGNSAAVHGERSPVVNAAVVTARDRAVPEGECAPVLHATAIFTCRLDYAAALTVGDGEACAEADQNNSIVCAGNVLSVEAEIEDLAVADHMCIVQRHIIHQVVVALGGEAVGFFPRQPCHFPMAISCFCAFLIAADAIFLLSFYFCCELQCVVSAVTGDCVALVRGKDCGIVQIAIRCAGSEANALALLKCRTNADARVIRQSLADRYSACIVCFLV